MRPSSLPATQTLAANKPHGNRVKYMGGCRCLPCRAANSNYEAERQQARKRGEWNGLVDATAARLHICRLSHRGVGRRAIAAATDLPESSIFKIKCGKRTRIRRSTEEKLLAVTSDAVSDAALVPATPTWAQIDQLLGEGFTKTELARRLGYSTPALQLGKTRILASSAAHVDRFFRMTMKEAQ